MTTAEALINEMIRFEYKKCKETKERELQQQPKENYEQERLHEQVPNQNLLEFNYLILLWKLFILLYFQYFKKYNLNRDYLGTIELGKIHNIATQTIYVLGNHQFKIIKIILKHCVDTRDFTEYSYSEYSVTIDAYKFRKYVKRLFKTFKTTIIKKVIDSLKNRSF